MESLFLLINQLFLLGICYFSQALIELLGISNLSGNHSFFKFNKNFI